MSSIFTRPRARPPLAAVSSQQNLIAVSTEDELLAALTSLPRSDGACYGRGINIVGDITLSRKIVLSRQHSGITITSSSKARMATSKPLDAAIEIICPNVTVDSIFLGNGFSATSFIVFGYDPILGITADDSRISNNEIQDNAVVSSFVNSSLVSVFCDISGNKVSQLGPSCVLLSGVFGVVGSVIGRNINFFGGISSRVERSTICHNSQIGTMSFSGGFGTCVNGNNLTGNIVLSANCSRYSIVGNHMYSNNIDTSASLGQNSIVANVDTGTITNAATDAVTSNT